MPGKWALSEFPMRVQQEYDAGNAAEAKDGSEFRQGLQTTIILLESEPHVLPAAETLDGSP